MSRGLPSEEVVDRVADLLRSRIGLRPEASLRSRLRRCIRDEAVLHEGDLESYLQSLSVTGRNLQNLLNRITVQETGFFRHPEHFEILASAILPRLSRPVRIWSAGCANGQEAFSLAMLLDENRVAGTVVATDLSTSALQRTATAQYLSREINGLSPDRVTRHMTATSKGWQINQSLRDRVTTARHNLVDGLPDEVRSCQVVFCRNVLIYFSPEHTRAVLDRLADGLPDAWLFLGSAEAIWPVSDRYETVRMGEAYAYRPRRARTAVRRVQRTSEDGGSRAQAVQPVTPHPEPARRATPAAAGTRLVPDADAAAVAALGEAGQRALAAGDHQSAVVHFRKWAFFAHDDALAHLHLGLALEAAGDLPSAQRAFGAARRALQETDHAPVEEAIGGYAAEELLRLVDAKLTP
ncbi:MAG: chemotaxis protein methyltransferase CheR [Actinomycetota bacterium]|nr:chemotaxis protein methyltransferase CheR [Actinomycetota bacterium]